MRIHDDFLDEAIAALGVRVGEPVQQRVRFRVFGLVEQVAPLLVAERFAVGDEELLVARVGLIDVGVINLVDDAVAEREPDAGAAAVRRADAVLGAGRPAWLNPWRAKGGGVFAHSIREGAQFALWRACQTSSTRFIVPNEFAQHIGQP